MVSLHDLDEQVKAAMQKLVIPPGIVLTFFSPPITPGHGCFTAKFSLGGALATYEFGNKERSLDLIQGEDTVKISLSRGAWLVRVNDNIYQAGGLADNFQGVIEEIAAALPGVHPQYRPVPEVNPDKEVALEFARNALDAADRYVHKYVPDACELSRKYFTRELVPPDDSPAHRSTSAVLEKFCLDFE